MSESALLSLPFIEAGQAQKHVTHNEALLKLDALVHLSVKSRALTAPPASPVEGDRYLVPAGATGAWAGQSGRIAAWQSGTWAYFVPVTGWQAWIAGEDKLSAFSGTAWVDQGGVADLGNVPMVGINIETLAENQKMAGRGW